MTNKNALVIGVGQCLSLARGTSRSGITILAGLSQKLTRKQAAEFSFLMGIPLIFLAFCYQIFDFFLEGSINAEPINLIAGFAVSFISGLVAIKFMLSFLEKFGLSVFGIYRIILGIIAALIIF
jgi:undecaprenyl-diphosphatase